MPKTVYIAQAVAPEKPSVEVLTTLDDAKATMRTTWGGIGKVEIQDTKQGGFTVCRCTLDGRLVGVIIERTISEIPTHL